ncbi:MAG: hypothetical protein M1839_000745 [Geoglossum umbratile]|nr:MAG: hypothetical protein M1839_000745 [Geoglossum umbratile]
MSRTRLVRRAPLTTRLKSYFNPLDFLLYLSEQFESGEWGEYQRAVSLPLGVGCNLVFLVARANLGRGMGRRDDVFGDGGGRGGWAWLASFVVHFLTLSSILNAIYTFQRKRRYRLFESSIDVPPSTPSAHRVRVDSSPLSSSPLRFLSTLIDPVVSPAEGRSHPDPSRDVWEIAVWDPTPLCLRLFCFFSPGHILVYFLLLPTLPTDPRPSTTVLTTVIFTSLLTVQLLYLHRSYSQQSKDTALIHKEVLHEYDTKYVHPRLNPQVRDVATQFSAEDCRVDVQTYTPTTIIKREFHTNPNPIYARHIDPSATPKPRPYVPSAATPFRQPQFRPSHQSTGDGGSLGIFSHANSPLKKPASSGFLTSSDESARRSRERSGSPLKRSSVGEGLNRRTQGGRQSMFGDVGGLGTPARRESGRF